MFRIYFSSMFLFVAAGVALVVTATSMPSLAAGLALLTLGSGGISAGLMNREIQKAATFSKTTAQIGK
jgi:predicted anti-sigma-YlaC factor YlaD